MERAPIVAPAPIVDKRPHRHVGGPARRPLATQLKRVDPFRRCGRFMEQVDGLREGPVGVVAAKDGARERGWCPRVPESRPKRACRRVADGSADSRGT